ncbi:MAG: tRNA pseudouridine(38-40) synthase TruA [Bacteroidia bacterium]|nr:tRNA pseudouridine(38-40) synthase TruA [Bacteroidia bacterium]
MARYFLTLSYNGTDFNGWQIQENTPNTIQQVLEEKMSMLLKEKIEITGCGRTDTGVNAKNYVAHFDSHCADLIENKQHWIYKFNTVLPPTIAVSNIQRVKEGSHARFNATRRIYYYYISRQKNPFRDQFSWYVYGDLDFDLMNKAAAVLLNYQDFTSFSKLNTQNKTNICHITEARWLKSGEAEWRFSIAADRFLRGMVRAIVGTLIMVGKNKITIDDFKKIIEAKDRKAAGNNAPANALFLVGIEYPKEVYSE